ncbi:MAG: glycosyltransferase family 4 protein [archaeon]
MKVAYFALSEVYGGNDAGFVHAHSVTYFLKKAGVDVTFFIGAPQERAEADVNTVFVKIPRLSNIFRVNPISFFRSFFEVRKKLVGVDIVHERFHVNPIDLVFLGKRKYVLEVNDPAIELSCGLKKVFYRWLVRMKYNRADAIIVQTETLKKIVSRHTDNPIYVVPNGVDTSRFRPDVKSDFRKKYGFSKSDVVVTFVGSFREWHGVLDVVGMARRIPNAIFVLVGEGKLFDEVKRASSGLKNLILTRAVDYDEIPGIMANSDVLIAPFNNRGFRQLDEYGFWWCPVKLFEYMASGKPVVSYDFPEVRKIVNDGGLLAKPGDLDEFVGMVERLVRSKDSRLKLGGLASRRARVNYSWESRVKEILRVYGAVLIKFKKYRFIE